MLQNNSQLKSLIDKLWQNFWEGGIANPLTANEQITYLIFMKRLDDLEAKPATIPAMMIKKNNNVSPKPKKEPIMAANTCLKNCLIIFN
jgi:hypothetical protein